jgi:chemotaxis protein methyltransferase WspC
MSLADFEALLQDRMGLDVESIGPQLVARAVLERQAACQLADAQTYLELVRERPSELQALIEAVIVSETWFFRDREAFALLARHAVEAWLPAHADGLLRLLSVPCATGEEPYSMAIALLESGFPAHRFTIDAVDISERTIHLARQALYGQNAFRGDRLEFRDRHFARSPSGYQLADAVRAKVSFRQGNLLGAGHLPGSAIYHAIFCRNVLIYFDPTARHRTVEVLTRLLTPGGLLFVGPSETALLAGATFASARTPLTFAFHKQEPSADTGGRLGPAPTGGRPTPLAPRRGGPTSPAVARAVTAPPALARVLDAAAGIEVATRLADEGRLREASELCAEHLRRHGPSARALHLMGLLCEAAGRPSEAIDCHRKALYLDPDHEETLLHLAFLLHKQGDTAGGDLLRGRARRRAQKGGGTP